MVCGKHSNPGCATCKKRKIKVHQRRPRSESGFIIVVYQHLQCDEVRPYCHRCQMIKKPCPGYHQSENWKFRSENSRVSFKVHGYCQSTYSSIQASAALRALKNPDDNLGPESLHVQTGLVPPIVISEVHSQCINEYVQLFFEAYVIPSDQHREPGWLNFLPVLYDSADEGSALRLIVDAAALAHYGNKHSTSRALVIAQEHYGSALRITHLELAGRKIVLSKHIMAAVLLMGLYEVAFLQSKILFRVLTFNSTLPATGSRIIGMPTDKDSALYCPYKARLIWKHYRRWACLRRYYARRQVD